ncbi:MAG: nuclear transport factor 2 family protein, partial [Deltaproteobacteria bacterium]|nr:nuclear transport factor 2 family protein [Deltaproteobacteria bacterium]
MDASDYQKIRQLFDNYIRMYSLRDDLLTSYFSEDFTGITGSGDFLVKDREAWIAITRQDFAQVKDPINIELKDLAIQLLADTIAVATSTFIIHLPIKEHVLSRKTARLVLIFRNEPTGWKISHSSISVSFGVAGDDEIYPLKDLEERNRRLEELITERTAQLSEANDKLQQTNEVLEMEIAERKQQEIAKLLDVSERKKTEKALIESEERFRSVMENVPNVAVQGYTLDGAVFFWNRASEMLYGYSAEEAVGANFLELIIPPEMREGV